MPIDKIPVAVLAARQWGRLHRRQLKDAGVSDAMISRWVADGYLHRVLPRVYAVGHTASGPEADLAAALLYAGPGAMLSHATAAWWWELIDRQPPQLHVSTPRSCSSPALHIEIHGRRELPRLLHRRLPVATVAQTLLDLATQTTERRLKRALAEADFRRLLDPRAIEALLRQGQRGGVALRRALHRYQPDLAHTRSELEHRFLELCESGSLPRPELNATVCGLMVDALWRDQKVVVELDGQAAHGTAAQMGRDHSRDLTLRAAGFTVLRYTWRQITREAGLVLVDLRRALQLG